MDSMEITGGHHILSERIITFQSAETIANNGFSEFYTGYYDQSGWEIRQHRNEEQCILYKLPREIVHGIIHHLEPMDIHRLRHTSRGFLQLTSVKDFGTILELTSAQQLQQLMQAVLSAPNIPPRFSQPVLFRPSLDELVEIKELRRTELQCQMCSENRGRPVVGGAAYDLRQHCLELPDETREDYHHRLYSMEERNNALWRAFDRSEHPPTLRPYCNGCERRHDLAYFSSDQLSPDTDHRICIGHEGKLKLCSHVQISWAELWTHVATYNSEEPGWKTIKAIFQRSPFSDCPACAQRVGQHGKAPAIIYAPKELQHHHTPSDSFLNFELGWKLVVLNLREGEVVTKELLRHALSRLQESFGDFCCPHLMFTDTAFMAPFSWHLCMYFREAGAYNTQRQCHQHTITRADRKCCACYATYHPNLRGKFMAHGTLPYLPRGSTHVASCKTCHFEYVWRLGESRITLEGQKIVKVKDFNEWDTVRCWEESIDPTTYRRDEGTRHIEWCEDVKCPNSKGPRRDKSFF